MSEIKYEIIKQIGVLFKAASPFTLRVLRRPGNITLTIDNAPETKPGGEL